MSVRHVYGFRPMAKPQTYKLEFGHLGWVAQCRNQAVENGSFHFRDVGGLT
jgi:hypothetical protein